MKKVELLAPAGSYEAFLGAVHAGADAVYFGGKKFGARAYADNFTEEEIKKALRYAHLHGRKAYLTLNTLVKTREFGEIRDYLQPLYDAGLDGVIIQDLGVFQAVGEWFPGLPRHVSTQMGITGVHGARFLRTLGAERIVPARELSLTEIVEMKNASGLEEIETFIHGAICYCYSGQCLFSSLIGGRSGNRGRCAQPCRLPYRLDGKTGESYPLSLKDMCTVEILPELIRSGIDSLKIEGRMKSPEYAAGVTAIYRKYIDRYYGNPSAEWSVEPQDMEKLRALYIRSGISEGYYHRVNGREMITLDSPAYSGRDGELAEQIRKEYLEGDFRLPVLAKAVLKKGAPAMLTLRMEGAVSHEVSVTGDTVQEAKKQPLDAEAVKRQLGKTGNTPFCIEDTDLELQMEGDVFLPVKALNDLRRIACGKLEDAVIAGYGSDTSPRRSCGRENPEAGKAESEKAETRKEESEKAETRKEESEKAETGKEETGKAESENPGIIRRKRGGAEMRSGKSGRKTEQKCGIHVSAVTKEQCMAAVNQKAERLYVPSGLCGGEAWLWDLKERCGGETGIYLALPHIIRAKDGEFLDCMERLLGGTLFDGVLVRNPEEWYWLVETFGKGWDKQVVSDAGLYQWNPRAARVFGEFADEHYLPHELNFHEIRELVEATPETEWAAVVYGRIPMMVTANCIVKTGTGCRPYTGGKNGRSEPFEPLTDRYRKVFPVYTDCTHCYNVVYNSLPLSLHQDMEKLAGMGIHSFRLDFTTEIGNDVDRVVSYFQGVLNGSGEMPPYREYTKGHMKRGVE